MTTKPHELRITIAAEPRVNTYAQAVEIAEKAALSFFGEAVKPRLTYRVVMEQDPVAKRFIGFVFVYLDDENNNKEEQDDKRDE